MRRQLSHHVNFVKSFVRGETTTSRPMRLAIGIGQIIDQNVCAAPGKCKRVRPTQSLPCARHNGHLAKLDT